MGAAVALIRGLESGEFVRYGRGGYGLSAWHHAHEHKPLPTNHEGIVTDDDEEPLTVILNVE